MDACHINFRSVQAVVDHVQIFHSVKNLLIDAEMLNEYSHQNLSENKIHEIEEIIILLLFI